MRLPFLAADHTLQKNRKSEKDVYRMKHLKQKLNTDNSKCLNHGQEKKLIYCNLLVF